MKMAPHSFIRIRYLLLIFLIKRGLLWNKTSLVCLMRRMQILNIAIYGHRSWRIPMSSPPALHPLPGLAGLNSKIYIYRPQQWVRTSPRRVARDHIIKLAHQRPRGSQVKTLEAHVPPKKISEFSTIFSQNIGREIYKYLQTIYSAPYLLVIFESVTFIHTILRIQSSSLICVSLLELPNILRFFSRNI